MVTHELTVFPDGRIDGAFSVREGDYNSHTLRFVLTQDLTAASAKLLLWPAGAEKPTVYGVLLGHGQAAGQDVQFTPVSWGKAPSRTQIQLELLDNNGNIIWQSRRLCIPVEPGIPDDALPEPVDTSDATAGPGDVALGKTFYAQGEKKTGSYVSDGIQPRAWADIPIDYILCEIEESGNKYYFQRVSSSEFMLVVPQDDVGTVIATFAVDEMTDIYMEGIKVGEATDKAPLTLTLDMGQPISVGLKWRENSKEALISVTVLGEDDENACLEVNSVSIGPSAGTFSVTERHVVTRKGEVFYFYVYPEELSVTIGRYRVTRAGTSAKLWLVNERINEDTGYPAKEWSSGNTALLATNKNENFVIFELTTASGKYRKKYCISWRASVDMFFMDAYTYPVLAVIEGDLDFFDYVGKGFPPKEPHAQYADLEQTAKKFRTTKTPKDRYGRVTRNAGGDIYEEGTDSADYKLKNAVIDAMKTVQIGCNITEKENLLSVGPQYAMLGKNSLTDACYWLMIANGKLVDMPGFLTYVWPSDSVIIDFWYTCADGLDVGYPYARE